MAAQFVTGLARVPDGIGGAGPSVRFEQYERHTAWDRPGGVANRSGAGDLDVIIYSARKWARLALAGNPTVRWCCSCTRSGHGHGTGQSASRTARGQAALVVVVHGSKDDPWGWPGTTVLLSTGRITLPVPEPDRAYLRSIRLGERPLSEVLEAISDAEARLAALRDSAAIADQPDRPWVDGWLHRTYQNFWDLGH